MADRTTIVMNLGMAVIVIALGMQVMAVYDADTEVSEYAEAAEAYCHQELGPEAELYMANVIGSHGGLHCDGPNGEIIHLHDVPKEEVMAAAENDTA